MDFTYSSDYAVIYAQVRMERDLYVRGLFPIRLFPDTEFFGLVGLDLHVCLVFEGVFVCFCVS